MYVTICCLGKNRIGLNMKGSCELGTDVLGVVSFTVGFRVVRTYIGRNDCAYLSNWSNCCVTSGVFGEREKESPLLGHYPIGLGA